MTIRESFDSMFKLVEPNSKFKSIKTALFYYLIGGCLLEYPILNKKLDIDMRFSFICAIASGYGKKAFGEVVFEVCKSMEKECISFTSLHEEQLIGKKFWSKEEKDIKEVRGYFDKDFLIKDDALTFFNNSKFEVARNYMLTALDIYGKNRIYKRIVEMNDALEYYGRCSFLGFIQINEKINNNSIASGLFRRVPILRVDLTKEEKEYILENNYEEFKPQQQELFEFFRNIRNIRNISYLEMSQELIEKINKKCKEYYTTNEILDSIYIINKNNIIKFSYINALIRHYNAYKPYNLKTNIELSIIEEDIDKAIVDYDLIYNSIKNFIDKNRINLHPIKQEILNLLKERNCLREESSNISSSEVIRLIKEKTNENEATIKYHFYEMKGKIIDSKQNGQYGSKVWIK